MRKIECSNEELNNYKLKYNLELTWFDDMNYKLIIDGAVVALISYTEYESRLEIESFEVLTKKNRFGSSIVQLFKMEYTEITLYPDNGSNLFWESQGFQLRDDGTGTLEYYYGNCL